MLLINNSIIVSIIVPIYDTAEYLRRCLDSCVYQSLSEIEVILVNDCSPDRRDEEIALEYKEQYPQKVVYIKNEKNLGLGAARNKGLTAAKGTYILCVDSDDYISFDTCELMYQKALEKQADLVMCGYHFLRNGEVTSFTVNESHIPVMAVIKLFRRDIIINGKLFFPEHLLCEDYITILWNYASKKTACVSLPLYYYVSRQNSIKNSYNEMLMNDVVSVLDYSLSTEFFISLQDATIKREIVTNCLSRTMDMLIEESDDDESLGQNITKVRNIIKKNFLIDYLNTDRYLGKRNAAILKMETCNTKKLINELNRQLTIEEFSEFKNRRITLWGCGRQGKQLAQRLQSADIVFECVDINPNLHGTEMCGHIVLNPDRVAFNEKDTIFVSVKGKYEEIKKKLGEGCCILDKS